jgi:hypothetical protein
MFANIRARGLEAIAALMGTEDEREVADEARCLGDSSAALRAAFDLIDADKDGCVSVQEILNLPSTLNGGDTDIPTDQSDPLTDFLNFVRSEMELGSCDEDISTIPCLRLDDLTSRRR